MFLFADDIRARQITTAPFLKAQALLGLGHLRESRVLLEDVLAWNPNHALVADILSLTESAR